MNSNGNTQLYLLKKLFRSLKEDYKQYLSILFISFLAVCLFSGLNANADLISRRVDNIYSLGNIGDVFITYSPDSTYIDDLTYLKNNDDNIEEIFSRGNITAANPNADLITNKNGSNINLLINDDNNTISVPYLIEGSDDFAITKSYAEANNYKIGDTITLEITNPFYQSETLLQYQSIIESMVLNQGQDNFIYDQYFYLEYEITGIMYHPKGIASSQFSDTYIYCNTSYIYPYLENKITTSYNIDALNSLLSLIQMDPIVLSQDLVKSYLYNQIVIKTKDIDKTKEVINSYFSNKETNNLILLSDVDSLQSSQQVNLERDQAKKLTYVFPTIFYLVSVLIISTTIGQLILKERLQIGSLKAMGVNKSSIYLHYLSYGATISFIGGLIGFIVGPLLIPNVMGIKYSLLWDIPSLGAKFFLPMSILSLLVMVFLAFLVGFIVLYKTLKEKVVSLLRNTTPSIKGGNLNIKHLSLSSKMCLRNILSSKAKSVMIILGTMGCTALLVCGFGIMDTLNYGLDLDMYTNTSIPLTVNAAPNDESIYETLNQVEGISNIEQAINYPIDVYFNGSEITTTVTLMEKAESDYLNFSYDEGVTLSYTLADTLNIKEGDIITLNYNQKIYQKEVKTIVKSSILNGLYGMIDDYDNLISPNLFYMNYDRNLNKDELRQTLLSIPNVNSVNFLEDTIDEANNLLGSIQTMTNVIKIFAILLSIVVIYNLIALNIQSRRRDIATMKVLGFHFKEIQLTLFKELVLLTFIGSSIGLLLGYPLTVLTLSINKTNLISFLYHVNVLTYFIAFLISIVTAIVLDLLLTLKIKKISMIESLKSVE